MRGRIPPLLVVFVVAFAIVGLVGFQISKERRTASANISEKESELENLRRDLEDKVKVLHEREKERDTAQTKLLALEQESQKVQISLGAKDTELQNVRADCDSIMENFRQLKKVVKQRDQEIVAIRGKQQDYSFEKAKESAEEMKNHQNNVMESTLDNRKAEEHKPADEAGLDDRKELQKVEEAIKDGDVSALEKEMDERSKPKPHVRNEGETLKDNTAEDKVEEASNPGDPQDEISDELDNVDTRDLDEKEIEAMQEEHHEELISELGHQSLSHEDMDAQGGETDV